MISSRKRIVLQRPVSKLDLPTMACAKPTPPSFLAVTVIDLLYYAEFLPAAEMWCGGKISVVDSHDGIWPPITFLHCHAFCVPVPLA